VHLFAMDLAADLAVLPAAEYATAARHLARTTSPFLGGRRRSRTRRRRAGQTAAQLLSSSVLQPVLGNALARSLDRDAPARARDPEQTLLRSRLCIPLVFFHDLWQTSRRRCSSCAPVARAPRSTSPTSTSRCAIRDGMEKRARQSKSEIDGV
jgi:hypothetical protein